MTYDPAWDMPRVNWQQQGSFEIPEIPPAYEPDAEPLVCLPRINQYWLPYVMGALDQLRNPSSWLVADDDAMATTLYRVSRLKQMIGAQGECMSYAVRFDAGTCQLQESTDGGGTWFEVEGWEDFTTCLPPQTLVDFDSGCTLYQSLDGGSTYDAVPGWIDNFSGCVQKYTPIIGLPPNPGDKTPDQLACAIAKYLAEQVVVAAMGKAVTAISDDLTLLQFGLDVVNIIPEFVLVTLAADAFSAIYVAVQEGTLSDYEDALTDATLLSEVICAIYGCIEVEGYVKPANFDCILSSVGAIAYTHSDVITAIVGYLTALGATGLAQLSQVAGLETGEECTACAWCYKWGQTAAPIDSPVWPPIPGDATPPPTYTVVGDILESVSTDGPGTQELHLWQEFDLTYIASIEVGYIVPDGANGGSRTIHTSSGANLDLHTGPGTFVDTLDINTGEEWFDILLDTNETATGPTQIVYVKVLGSGTCPFGTPICS